MVAVVVVAQAEVKPVVYLCTADKAGLVTQVALVALEMHRAVVAEGVLIPTVAVLARLAESLLPAGN